MTSAAGKYYRQLESIMAAIPTKYNIGWFTWEELHHAMEHNNFLRPSIFSISVVWTLNFLWFVGQKKCRI